jgi:16S rRNA C967 or C1407 C5-methylase (RsmB/RsmF family)
MARRKGTTKRFRAELEKRKQNEIGERLTTKQIIDARKEEGKKVTWSSAFVKENASFQEYYKENGVVPQDQYDEFLAALRRPLPTTFRVVSSGYFVDHIMERLDKFSHMAPVIVKNEVCSPSSKQSEGKQDEGKRKEGGDGERAAETIALDPPAPLPWYPDRLGWQFDIPRCVFRNSPEFAEFHRFLALQTEQGNICRQEAVSMIPVLFLDVQPQHKVTFCSLDYL